MEHIKSLPIINTSEPMVGSNMHKTIEMIYETYAKSIPISHFLPTLPKKIEGMLMAPIYFTEKVLKFIKFQVDTIILICTIQKFIEESTYKYYIKCCGINNIVDIFDFSLAFEIVSTSNQINSRGIRKSTLPGLESGTVVTNMNNALIKYFQPESFSRSDAAQIHCKNGEAFPLSWFRLLTKPTNTDDMSWYDSFGLKRVFPYVSNKQKLADTIDRIKHITVKELENYYKKVLDLFSHKKYSDNTSYYIPNGYFLYYYNKSIRYEPHIYDLTKAHDTYNKSYKIVQKVSPTMTLSELIQTASCEERAVLFDSFPYYGKFVGFIDTDLTIKGVFPKLRDFARILDLLNEQIDRIYSFKRSKSKTQKKKRT